MSCACNIPLALLITVLVASGPTHACIPPERPFLPASREDMRTYADLIRGDFEAGDAFYLALNNTPYVNLWYTRAALDYAITYHIQEMLSPGVLRRRERRLKEEFGQEFILPPSSVIKRGGGYR